MNYLSHHFVARAVAGDAPPAFYVGNVLPDLMALHRGGGRLRPVHLPDSPDPDLARGVALHLATDRGFHAAPAFARATAEASAALRAAPFTVPPRRLFFLAHAFVEIALDAVLLRADTGLADHLYTRFQAADLAAIAAAAEAMLGRPLPPLARGLADFARSRYLYSYGSDGGLADALHGISLRAGLPGFASPADRACLGARFAAFLPRAAELGHSLWQEKARPW